MKNDSDRSLNLFLSYGHEESTKQLVDEIKVFFEKRNHHVWRDKELIRKGADWRREIIDGINISNNVLALLTEHAIGKEHAVCLDELRISVSIPGMNVISVLLEPEKDLDIPCTISRNQFIDMSNWRSMNGTPEWDNYFNEKMLSLAEWIESEEHFQFQGEITTVKNMLLPDISDCKYYSLLEKKLIGREWLSKEFDNWLLTGKEKFLLLKGGPGTGKSHFCANKAHYNPNIIATYFCEFDKINDNSAKNFVRSVCFQIATKLPDFRHWVINGNDILDKNDVARNLVYFAEKTDGELFSKLIAEPLFKTINGNIGNKCILIDGLDEATRNSNNPIVNMVTNNANMTPDWIKFAITSRDEKDIADAFQGYPSIVFENAESKKDIVKYIAERLQDKVDASRINKIAEKSEYMFIFAEKYCDAFLNGLIDRDNIPDSIGGLYYYYFKRLFTADSYKNFRKGLSVIASFDLCNLTEEVFKAIMKYDNENYLAFLSAIKAFIVEEKEGKKSTIRFYHKSIKDWIICEKQSGMFSVDINEGKKIICEFSEKVMKSPDKFNYDILKTAYIFIDNYGDIDQKIFLNRSYEFLSILQRKAYDNTDISVFKNICSIFNNILNLTLKSDKLALNYCAKSYFLECQFEIDRDNKELARSRLLFGRKKFKNVLKKDFHLKIEVEENIFWTQDDSFKKEKDILRLINIVEKSASKNRYQELSNLYYSYAVYLYNRQNYQRSLDFLDKSINTAELIIDESSRKNTLFRIFNEKGSCLSRLKKHDEAITYFELSLKMRLDVYGTYNHYTAIGYDALARGYLYKAESEENLLQQDVENLAKTALKINNTLFGENNKMSARNLFTISKIHNANREYNKALEYAEKSRNIYKSYDDIGATNMLDVFIAELKTF